MYDDEAIGLAYSGLASFRKASNGNSIDGVNVSSWLSRHYRRRGFGNDLIEHATIKARTQSYDKTAQDWYGKSIWTSIKIGNIASTRACEKVGYIDSGLTYDDPTRRLYLLQS